VEKDPSLLFLAHREGGRFFNPWSPWPHSGASILKWALSRNRYDKRRRPEVPIVENDGSALAGREHSGSATWVGHATFAVHDDEDVFLTDPHFGPRALVPRRKVPPGVPIESVPGNAFAVVSHNHYDHLDEYTVRKLPETVAWFVPLGLGRWLRDRGRESVVELDWWQSARHGRWTVTCLPAQHWSRRIGQRRNETLWCSWLLDSGKRRYYFAGDTGYFRGFREFSQRFAPIDVAMLPIGAYEPRWFMTYHHMDPAEAYQAFEDLGARFLLPMHWGTFDLTDEPVDLPPKVLREVVSSRGGDAERVRVLAIGERFRIPDRKGEERV
jgi:N-acyl-phosphatidylethanolamine-hydrolysing phospholipase D